MILERYPETVVAETLGATFFSLDEKGWPNYATIVTTPRLAATQARHRTATDGHDPTGWGPTIL